MPIFVVMSLPVLLSVGAGVDMTRMTLARSALQSAVDGAALAAAAAGGYSKSPGPVADANAINAANNYFNGNYTHGGQGASVKFANGPTITTPPATSSGYQVTVAAQGTMSTTILGLTKLVHGANSDNSINTVTIQAHATANNRTTPGTVPTLVLNSGNDGSTAADWNAAYIYLVPFNSDGVTRNFGYLPKASDLYLIGTNCPAANRLSNLSQYCYQPSAQNCSPTEANAFDSFPNDQLDAPIAMLFINVTNGRANLLDVIAQTISYGSPSQGNMNAYGARFGSCQVFMTALISAGLSPSKYADSSGPTAFTSAHVLNNTINLDAITNHTLDPVTNSVITKYSPLHTQTTHYSDVTSSTQSNCLLVVQNIDPNAVPSLPPLVTPKPCFSVTDTSETASGKQFANLSCNQMAGRTFMYWFNDMGWYPNDDKDYQNLSFSFRCTATGTVATGPVTTPVSLLQ